MYLLFRPFVRPLLWALSPLRELGTPESDDDFFDPTTGTQRDPHQPREDECPPGQHRKVPGGPCIKPHRCPPGKVRLADGRCHDECTKAQLRANGAAVKRCRDAGGEWIVEGRCKGRCKPKRVTPGVDCTKTPNHPDCRKTTEPCPEGQRRVHPDAPCTKVDTDYDTRSETVDEIVDRAKKVTPQTLLADAEAAGATFDPLAGQPPKLAPHSLADVLADPRYLAAAAERERGTRQTAGALGLTGTPVLSAVDAGKRALLGPMSNLIFGQNLQQHGADVAHGRDTYNRLTGNWQRWWEPTRFGTDFGLRTGGLALGAADQALKADDQAFRHWWMPESQQRGFGEARWHAGQGNLMAIINALAGAQYGGIQQPGWS